MQFAYNFLIFSLCTSLRVEGLIIGLFISIYYFKRSVKINPLPTDIEPSNIQRLAILGIIPPLVSLAKCQADSKRTFLAVRADYDITFAAISLACLKVAVFKGYALQVGTPNLIAAYCALFLFHRGIILQVQNRRRTHKGWSPTFLYRRCGLSGRRRPREECHQLTLRPSPIYSRLGRDNNLPVDSCHFSKFKYYVRVLASGI